ncbi:hypothetical protein F4819DRAFT_474669 [Hypoxylon fuscum]|nr:hypothetical protein F4819DRAFT_474669 [Hypoxylon fuscum]
MSGATEILRGDNRPDLVADEVGSCAATPVPFRCAVFWYVIICLLSFSCLIFFVLHVSCMVRRGGICLILLIFMFSHVAFCLDMVEAVEEFRMTCEIAEQIVRSTVEGLEAYPGGEECALSTEVHCGEISSDGTYTTYELRYDRCSGSPRYATLKIAEVGAYQASLLHMNG